jgi:hypothetical protein
MGKLVFYVVELTMLTPLNETRINSTIVLKKAGAKTQS